MTLGDGHLGKIMEDAGRRTIWVGAAKAATP